MAHSDAPHNDSDLTMTINEHAVRVAGWRDRHQAHPKIREQIEKCDGTRFQLLFRGTKKIPYQPELFVLGLKTRPQYSAGDPEMLSKHARSLAEDESLFDTLITDFVKSPMMAKKQKCSVAALKSIYATFDERQRVRLAQLLLYGLHYQNTRQEVAKWRDYLFVLSATTKPDVAVRFALGHRRKEPVPQSAFVIEYGPPCGGHCFERMICILDEFKELDLGEWFPDQDTEVLIPFGMLPHYVLGYSKLHRPQCDAGESVYSVEYVPNPAFSKEGCSLENPKDLDAEQAKKRDELNGQIAWAYHRWTGTDSEWFVLKCGQEEQDISGTGPDRS